MLRDADVLISWMDNVFIEWLWRSIKYECVYLNVSETGSELWAGLARRITYYNTQRPHSAVTGQTPAEAYGRIDASDSGGACPPESDDQTGGMTNIRDSLTSARACPDFRHHLTFLQIVRICALKKLGM